MLVRTICSNIFIPLEIEVERYDSLYSTSLKGFCASKNMHAFYVANRCVRILPICSNGLILGRYKTLLHSRFILCHQKGLYNIERLLLLCFISVLSNKARHYVCCSATFNNIYPLLQALPLYTQELDPSEFCDRPHSIIYKESVPVLVAQLVAKSFGSWHL